MSFAKKLQILFPNTCLQMFITLTPGGFFLISILKYFFVFGTSSKKLKFLNYKISHTLTISPSWYLFHVANPPRTLGRLAYDEKNIPKSETN